MAVFAGMLNAMDFHIGRLIEYLKNNGLYEDTIFIITSDNGPEGNDPRDHATWRAWYETSRWNNNLGTLGEEDSYVFIGTEFAQAMSHYPECKVEGDAVQAYRNYYHTAKPFAKWEWKRPAPDWWKGYQGANIYS